MYKQIKQCLHRNNLLPLSGTILGISGVEGFRPLISEKAKVIDARYPEVDMQDLPYDSNSFDCVISDQVIEHLEDPKKAIEESHRVLKENGIAIHTTCFINYIHRSPIDFWRFSPDALRYICEDCGFSQILQCEGWGNRIALLLCFVSDRFRGMNIPENRWSMRYLIATLNEERYPIVTWVMARK
jgi:ubiquinone/menaquinone biosynthesis C-methylase UbiE